MNKNKRSSEQGFAITALVAIVGLVSLAVTGTKVATHVYQKNETEKIANQFEEQAQHLAKRAEKMGKAGDEAVRESLRLHQAAKDIRKHGTLVYQQKMISEAAGLATSLVASKAVGGTAKEVAQGLGSTLDKAKAISEFSGMLVDVKGINEELAKAQEMVAKKKPTIETEEDKKLYGLIKGSRTNVDDFHLAQMKAMTDEIISMRKRLEEMGKEIEGWIAVREQALKDLERAAQKRRAGQRAEARLAVLENSDLSKIVERRFESKAELEDVIEKLSSPSREEEKQESTEAKREGKKEIIIGGTVPSQCKRVCCDKESFECKKCVTSFFDEGERGTEKSLVEWQEKDYALSRKVNQAYIEYLKAYDELANAIAEGKRDSSEGAQAYARWEEAKARYEALVEERERLRREARGE